MTILGSLIRYLDNGGKYFIGDKLLRPIRRASVKVDENWKYKIMFQFLGTKSIHVIRIKPLWVFSLTYFGFLVLLVNSLVLELFIKDEYLF